MGRGSEGVGDDRNKMDGSRHRRDGVQRGGGVKAAPGHYPTQRRPSNQSKQFYLMDRGAEETSSTIPTAIGMSRSAAEPGRFPAAK